MKRNSIFIPNLNIVSDLVEIYKDQLIKGCEHCCCEEGMRIYYSAAKLNMERIEQLFLHMILEL